MLNNERFQNILSEIEIKFDRGSSKNWINRDFEDLSFQIRLKTKCNISTLTLKRIFGKIKTPDDYLPQKATLQALENFSGVKANSQHQNSILMDVKQEPEINPEITPKNQKKKFNLFFITAIGILIISILSILFIPKKTENNALNGTIKLIKTEGENPKTAFFEYTTPNAKDSFKILFDEEYPAVNILNGNASKVTYYFQYPGLFNVVMMNKDKVVSDTIPVYVASKGWQALAYYFDQKYTERYFPLNIEKCCNSDVFHPSKKLLSETSLDTTKIAVIRIDNFRKTGKKGDNFTLETTLKNPEQWPGIRCNSIFLYVKGTNGTIRFRFANPGCSHWIDCYLSEKIITNNDVDLSNFTFSLNDWQQFRLENRNKNIRLYINNITRFSDSYHRSIGEIVGVTVLFHGNGYLKNYLLKDEVGKPIFEFHSKPHSSF